MIMQLNNLNNQYGFPPQAFAPFQKWDLQPYFVVESVENKYM